MHTIINNIIHPPITPRTTVVYFVRPVAPPWTVVPVSSATRTPRLRSIRT